jgi:hypothetical protein
VPDLPGIGNPTMRMMEAAFSSMLMIAVLALVAEVVAL